MKKKTESEDQTTKPEREARVYVVQMKEEGDKVVWVDTDINGPTYADAVAALKSVANAGSVEAGVYRIARVGPVMTLLLTTQVKAVLG